MANEPKPEEILDITGPEGETIFFRAIGTHVVGRESQLQAKLEKMWVQYEGHQG